MVARADGGVLVKVGSGCSWCGVVVVPADKCHHFALVVARSLGFKADTTQSVSVEEDVSSLPVLKFAEV